MKQYLILLFAFGFISFQSQGQQITAAEYFFNIDPGIGNGTGMAITSSDTVSFSGTVSTTGLSDGFHLLHIRTADANGIWSFHERRVLLIKSLIAASSLTSAEYFFDSDPGIGNGITIPVSLGDTISFAGLVPVSALSDGFHLLHIRTQDGDGNWSIAERRMFFIQNLNVVIPVLVSAEYFVDTDPGFGNGMPISVIQGDTLDFTGPLAIANTDTGMHTLFIRAKNSENVWSFYEARDFQISASVSINELESKGASVLFQNHPNPFSNSTIIEYYLSEPGDVSLFVADHLGRIVAQKEAAKMVAGMNAFILDMNSFQSGIYFYSIVSGDFVSTRKMVLTN